MTDKRISELTQITGANVDDANDELPIVDASASETKAITRGELFSSVASASISTVDINGGTIDGTVIGGTTPAAISGTTLEASGNVDFTGGDISFYEDTGTTPKFFWDASAESLGIGTSSPDESLVVAGDVKLTGSSDLHFTNTSDLIGIGAPASSVLRLKSNAASGRMEFQTNGSEAMRIDTSGNLLVGTTATTASAVGGQIRAAGKGLFVTDGDESLFINRLSSNGTVIDIRKDTVAVGSVSVTASATAYNTSSDYRLKEDVQPMTGAADRLMALKPVNFAWKADGSRVDGFLAHEAQEVIPEAVTGEKDAVDDEGNPEYQGIDQSKLVPVLTAALQEALGRIEKLEAEVAALKGA